MFVEYVSNRSLKMRAKIFKTYISILAIANCRNWLDASSRLIGKSSARFRPDFCFYSVNCDVPVFDDDY